MNTKSQQNNALTDDFSELAYIVDSQAWVPNYLLFLHVN